MKHGTKFNHTRSRVPSRSTYLLATHTHALFLRDSRAMWEARLSTRSWSRKSSRGTRRSISTSPGSWATAAWLAAFPKTVDAQIPSPLIRVIFRRHMREPFRDLRKLGDASVSSGFSSTPENKGVVNGASSPALPYLSEMLRTLVWVILEYEWSHNSPWTAMESRGPLVCPLVASRGRQLTCIMDVDAHWARSLQPPDLFFVEPLCCPHHCQFVLCRRWCVAPLFLWGRVGQVLVDVSTCRSGFVVHFCLILFFFSSSVPL